ncbi:unnamed protein product [Arabidopsis arenosa]|uniref:Protein kinase domain-containing protein n=1 Tax=Arabidopsis arenosa TaxID=38785 RepID=A0A8S1ZD51_ARAAE|nr:unnamed protein product [Arabidopsis arenosa]
MDQKRPTIAGDEEMAAEEPLKPALQKPPGFRDQQNQPLAPPSGTATLPRRRPRPIHPASLYPEKKRRCSFCRVFCCCVCIFLAVILLIFLIAVAVFFLWYSPKLPVVRLASFKISNFNFSDGKSDDGWSFLTADTTAVLDFRNPNGKLTFYYGDADVAVILGEKDFETNLGSTKVKGFIEKPGNRTAVIVPTRVRKRQVDDPTAKRLQAELKGKKLLVTVTAKTKVGLAVGSRKIVTVGALCKMEQFREIGEVLGSIRALMVFKDNIQINQRQCSLLLDLFTAAYESISESMRSNLRFKEKNTKWKILEQPLRELLWVVREGEAYVRMSLEPKLGFWAKAIVLHCNRDCTELHIHNLLSCLPIIVEAIETAGEVSGWDEEEMSKKRLVHSNKYMKQWNDSQMFTWKFGREYLVTEDFCNRFESAWTEDRWILIKELQEKKQPGSSKHDWKMADFLLKHLGDGNESPKLFPSSLLVNTKDYQVKKRLGNGSQYKEITWLGESFALRHFFGDIDALLPKVTPLLSLSHPNIVYYLCGFTDEEKKECFLVMELMSKTLGMHIKEVCGPRKKNTLSLPVAVDLMLQIALGMEYLHSKRIYHGELNPSNILVKPRSHQSGDGYLLGKIFGFGLNSVKGFSSKSASLTSQNENFPFIWYSPEVLEEQEQSGTVGSLKHTDKSDVYSFGMVCFELLTGKVPFEDSHLQGDKMSRNIRAGERPLFPFNSPKFITNLTKRCWHADPNQRPTFSSVSRILRYIKRFLALNPEYHSSSQQDPSIAPPVDYCEIESKLLQKLSWESTELTQVSQVPFEMFAYRVVERAQTCKKNNLRETSESGSEWASCSEDEGGAGSDEQVSYEKERRLSCSSDVGMSKKQVSNLLKRASSLKPIQKPGTTPRGRSRHPPLSPCGQSMRANSESQLILISPRIRRSNSGHASDSELS